MTGSVARSGIYWNRRIQRRPINPKAHKRLQCAYSHELPAAPVFGLLTSFHLSIYSTSQKLDFDRSLILLNQSTDS